MVSSGKNSTVSQAEFTALTTFFSDSMTHLLVPVVPDVNSMTDMRSMSAGSGSMSPAPSGSGRTPSLPIMASPSESSVA